MILVGSVVITGEEFVDKATESSESPDTFAIASFCAIGCCLKGTGR